MQHFQFQPLKGRMGQIQSKFTRLKCQKKTGCVQTTNTCGFLYTSMAKIHVCFRFLFREEGYIFMYELFNEVPH